METTQFNATTHPSGGQAGSVWDRLAADAAAVSARTTPARLWRVTGELRRHRRRLRHRPTLAQLGDMIRHDGSEPCSYRLDPAANWLPESLPAAFPLGGLGLCFTHRDEHGLGERVVLPNGLDFALV